MDKLRRSPNLTFFSCESDHYSLVVFETRKYKNESYLSLVDVAVRPEFRGKGWFSKLVKAMEATGRPTMIVDVMNPIVAALCEKRGYRTIKLDPWPTFVKNSNHGNAQ